MIRYLGNWLLLLLPVSGFYKFKRFFLSLCSMNIASGVFINGHTWFYGRGQVNIGASTWIGPRCRFYSDQSVTISIGDNCDIAQEVSFVTGSHKIGTAHRRAGLGYCKPIVVEDGCWIGTRVTIMGGVTIGKGAVIGAGSLVIKDITMNSVVAGVPAKQIKILDYDDTY